MKYPSLLFFIIVLLCFSWLSSAQTTQQPAFDCKRGLNNRVPKFTSFTLFPNPVYVGQTAHLRTIVEINEETGFKQGNITDGTIVMELEYEGEVFANIGGIPLCNASSAIMCKSIGPGQNAISFNYEVPKIPPGLYTITIQVFPNKATGLEDGCLTFDITVLDNDEYDDNAKYVSWIKAELAGIAQFEHDDYLARSLGEFIQVGPIGSFPTVVSYTFPWGTFINWQGSGDLVAPGLDTGGYVWGLYGDMEEMAYKSTQREHLYRGIFSVGYVSSLSQRTFSVDILEGKFVLIWQLKQGADGVLTSTLTGNITFDEEAVLPFGWSEPITVGRLVQLSVETSSEGILLVMGTQTTCTGDKNCMVLETSDSGGDDGLEGSEIGLLVGILVGVVVIFVLAIALFYWRSQRRRTEEEDGIFSASRKPEYGNALVVDDIIQETREHSPNLIPPLNRNRQADFSDDGSQYSHRTRSRSRTPDSYTRSRTPSRSRSRSAGRSRSDSASYSDYSEASGSSASRA